MGAERVNQVSQRSSGTSSRSTPVTVLLVVGASIGILSYILLALQRIGYPYELTYFEGSTIEVTARLVDGLPLYGPPSPEFVSWPYPPMYFWLTGAASDVFGLSLPTMRWVSFTASLVVLALMAAIVWRVTSSRVAALLGAGLYAATYRVAGAWADTARIDSVFLAWLLGSVLVAMRARTWRGGIAVGLLVVAAFLTKQNAILAAAPVLIALLIRRRAVGVSAAATAVVGCAATVVIGDLVTDGWYSPYVVFQLLGHPLAPQWLLGFWFVDVLLPFALVAVAGTWLAIRHRESLRIPRISTIGDQSLIVFAAIMGLLLAGLAGRLHEGGTTNVAMPTHVAMAIALAIGLHAATSSGVLSDVEGWVLGCVVIGQMIVLMFWRTGLVPTIADRAAGDAFISALASARGPVSIPSHPYYARLAGIPTAASSIAVVDLMASRSNRARDDLASQLPWSLSGYNLVIADSPDDAARLGPELERDFTLVSTDIVPGDLFEPVSDVPAKPSLVFVRTVEFAP